MEDEQESEMRNVLLPSGAPFAVHNVEEQYFNDRVRQYLADNQFSNVSDLQDLDRVMIGELLIWRWGAWLMKGSNYWGESVEDASLQKQIKEISTEIRQVKSALALDKISRDRQRGEDSVSAYLANLRRRAVQFGYKRNEELDKIMEIFHSLKGKITFHDNCDEEERIEQKATLEHIAKWLREKAFPEFDRIDERFRNEGPDAQKLWIQDQ